MATQKLTPTADQPRVSSKELGKAESRGAGGQLQYKNVDVRINPARQAQRKERAVSRT